MSASFLDMKESKEPKKEYSKRAEPNRDKLINTEWFESERDRQRGLEVEWERETDVVSINKYSWAWESNIYIDFRGWKLDFRV